jgi:hypothetical protein
MVAEHINKFVEVLKENLSHLSAEALGWVAVMIIHLSTIPTLLAVLTGVTEKFPPVDLFLLTWLGLVLFFIKAAIQKDMLNVVTIGIGFFVQASLAALILFK